VQCLTNEIPKKQIVKLAVLGAGGSGKSTLITRLVTGNFIETDMTVGFDVESWVIDTGNDQFVKVTMFDMGGQHQFRFFQESLVIGAKIALLVFDSTSFRSLMQINEWIEMIESIPQELRLLVGTKIDVEDAIDEEDIKEYADSLGIDYILVSSKTGENIEKLLDKIQTMINEM
jgi:small GTP-binding protein